MSDSNRRKPMIRTAFITVVILLMSVIFVVIVARFSPTTYYGYVAPFASRDLSETADFYDDVPYCGQSINSRTLDLYVPKNRPFGQMPLVVYIHGGGWREGDKDNSITNIYAPETVAYGMSFATVNYRLTTEAPYPAQNEDVHCALEYLINNAEKYGYKNTDIGLMGDSAGGHLAAMEALQYNTNRQYGAVVMLYGVSNLWNQIENYNDKNAVQYLGQRTQELADAASPYYSDLKNAPPFLIIHGTDDTVVPNNESAAFAEKLEQHNIPVTYLPVLGARHAFVGGDYHETFVRSQIMRFLVDTLYN